jgi:ArsR family transcriptional regulator, arsenate/arsenite/antimonite-responsive transcriptional repressor
LASLASVECCPSLVGDVLSAEEADQTAALFKTLADPTRVRIVNLLAASPEPVCLCDINASFELSQPTLSHHLKKLVDAGLLEREQRGTWAFYSINDQAFGRLGDIVKQKEIQ